MSYKVQLVVVLLALTVWGCGRADGTSEGPIISDVVVSAENVQLNPAGNTLEETGASNLQTAIDKVLVPDLAKVLQGTRWKVKNLSENFFFKDTEGELIFHPSSHSFEMASGRMAAGGFISINDTNPDVNYMFKNVGPIEYKDLGDRYLYCSYLAEVIDADGHFQSSEIDSLLRVIVQGPDRIVIVGDMTMGGAGHGGTRQVSVLTKIQ